MPKTIWKLDGKSHLKTEKPKEFWYITMDIGEWEANKHTEHNDSQ